jgi:hypothetical protein
MWSPESLKKAAGKMLFIFLWLLKFNLVNIPVNTLYQAAWVAWADLTIFSLTSLCEG